MQYRHLGKSNLQGLRPVPGHHDVRRPDRPRPRPRASWPTPTRTASTSSTPPTSTPRAAPRPWWANCSRASATTGCWPPSWATGCRTGPTKGTTRAAGCCARCEASLQRLQTDHIDILYLHRDYNGMDLEEPLRALDAMLRAGKIRYWGVSNFRGWRIAEMVRLARAAGHAGPGGVPALLQPAQPHARGGDAAGLRSTTASAWCPTARSRAACSPASTRRAQPPGRRHARRPRRQAHRARPSSAKSRCVIAQQLKAHAEGQGHRAGAVRHRLGAGAPRPSARSSPGRARSGNGRTTCPRSTTPSTAEDEALVDSLVQPGHPSTPGYNDPAYPLNGRVRPALPRWPGLDKYNALGATALRLGTRSVGYSFVSARWRRSSASCAMAVSFSSPRIRIMPDGAANSREILPGATSRMTALHGRRLATSGLAV